MNRIEEIAKAYAMGRAYAQGLKHRYAMAMDKEEWRTLKPKKDGETYRHVMIETETGMIIKGFGAGKTLKQVYGGKDDDNQPTHEEKVEALKKSMEGKNLQNRDRSTVSSREQIRKIGAKPDYDRLSTSKTFTDGAPVVAWGEIPEKQIGKTSKVVGSDGTKYEVKYAVVEADKVVATHDVNGFKNSDYSDTEKTELSRAIAGNGRTAGIKLAYEKGNADEYRNELIEDTDHGIDPDVIKGMKQPVLVRVMKAEDVSNDIADKTNTVATMSLSNLDRVKTDNERLNNSGVKLDTDDNGDLTVKGIGQFVKTLPEPEQAQYYDKKGNVNRQAEERAYQSAFMQAYNNDELFSKAFEQVTDRRSNNLLKALENAAPTIARLKGLPDGYDVRELITEGAIKYLNQKEGKTTAGQEDFFLGERDNDITEVIAQQLSERSRSSEKMERFLVRFAKNLEAETKKAPDMFGDVEKDTVKSVLNKTTLVQDSTARMSDSKREVWNRYGYSLIKSIAEGNEQNFDFKPFYEKLRA